MMDIVVKGDSLSGLNGVFEHIVEGTLNDPRWVLVASEWDGANKIRLQLAFMKDNVFAKQILVDLIEADLVTSGAMNNAEG